MPPKRDLPVGVRRCKGTLQVGFPASPGRPWRWESVAKALGKAPREVTVQDAVNLRIRRLAAVHEGRYVGPEVSKVTVRDVLLNYAQALCTKKIKSLSVARPEATGLDRYAGTRVYKLRVIDDTLGRTPAKAVTTFVIRRWAEDLRHRDEYAPGTVHNIAWVLHAALKQARRDHLLGDSYAVPEMPELETSPVNTTVIDPDSIGALLTTLKVPMSRIVGMAYLTGRRGLSECRLVRCEYVNLRSRVLILPDSKNGEGAAIPLQGELLKLIEEAWADREYRRPDGTTAISEWLFHENGQPLSKDTYYHRWRDAFDLIGLDATPHALRRTFVSDGLDAGMDERTVMELAGWKSRQVFDRHYNNARTLTRLRAAQANLLAFRQVGQTGYKRDTGNGQVADV